MLEEFNRTVEVRSSEAQKGLAPKRRPLQHFRGMTQKKIQLKSTTLVPLS